MDVCGKHFRLQDYKPNSERLFLGAVPSLNLPNPPQEEPVVQFAAEGEVVVLEIVDEDVLTEDVIFDIQINKDDEDMDEDGGKSDWEHLADSKSDWDGMADEPPIFEDDSSSAESEEAQGSDSEFELGSQDLLESGSDEDAPIPTDPWEKDLRIGKLTRKLKTAKVRLYTGYQSWLHDSYSINEFS